MKRATFLVTAVVLGAMAGGAQAMPIGGGALGQAADAAGLVEKAQAYMYGGRRYCFYFDGWQGPGWYRCGYAWRRGLGWGGVYGWRGWDYGPAIRRFGHRGGGDWRDRGRRDGGMFRSEGRRDGGRGPGRGPGGRELGGNERRGTTTGQGPRGPSGGGPAPSGADAGSVQMHRGNR